jgi:hypothetical protein
MRQIEAEVRQQQELHELEPAGLAANHVLDAIRNHQSAGIAERDDSGHTADANDGPRHDEVEYIDSKTRSKSLLIPMKREEPLERDEDQRGGAEKLEFSDRHRRG